MASSLNNDLVIGGASFSTRNVSGLADSRVWKAGSGYGKSCKHPKNTATFRVASLNVATLKRRSNEVVETITRRNIDICAIQEHRWSGGIETNQTRMLKGKNSKYKFFWCGNRNGLGGAGFLLAEKWIEKVFDIQRSLTEF